MDDAPMTLSLFAPPSADAAERSVQEARDLFGRTLARWASDVLDIRRCGLDRCTWGSTPFENGEDTAWSMAA